VIQLQNYANFRKVTSANHNERFIDFLKFALYRIIETAIRYESEAKNCTDSTNKLFLYYLAGKKRVQHVILEMIASNSRGKPLQFSDYSSVNKTDCKEMISLANADANTILKYALARAEKDCNIYLSLAALEEDPATKKLLVTLSKLGREFITDISNGYNKFATKELKV
jgi:hypothetical protein